MTGGPGRAAGPRPPRRLGAAPALALLLACRPAPPPPAPPEPFDPPVPVELGVNVGGTLSGDPLRLYADVVRTSLAPERADGAPAAVDRDGWPLEDFTLPLWRGLAGMHGTYALAFEGLAGRVEVARGDAALDGLHHDAAANRTSGRLVVRGPGAGDLALRFTGTRRAPAAPAGSGLRAVSLRRPVAPGAGVSEPPGALFHAPALALLRRFQVVRFMDFLATNGNRQREWAERARPGQASFDRLRHQPHGWQGLGGPWEHVALLANALGADPWITIPAEASDDYVRRVALLLRHGSDGQDPYPAPVDRPAYPPLDPARRLYVEYSNEVWNRAPPFLAQSDHNQARALAEVAAGGSPLDFDGLGPRGARAWAVRRIAARGMRISELFREVFGDDQMMVRVRPVLATQAGDGQGTLSEAARLLLGAAAGLERPDGSPRRPPGHWFWGAGGSGYYGPDPAEEVTLDGLWRSGTMDPARWAPDLARDADLVAALGLRRACYEGGPSLDRTGHGDAVKAAAAADPRMAAAVLEHQAAWSAHGGGLFVVYQAVGDHRWGLTRDVHLLDTPRLRAVEAILAGVAAPLVHGQPLPARLEGNRFSVVPRAGERPGPGGRTLRAGTGGAAWASYTLRAPRAGRARVTLEVAAGRPGRLAALWDGRPVGEAEAGAAGGALDLGEVAVGQGLHGLVVAALRGDPRLEAVRVEPVAAAAAE